MNNDDLDKLLSCKIEDENLEFKSAVNSFSESKDLPDYCAALANERGGKLILGVNNKKEIIGTKAFFGTHKRLTNNLLTKIGIKVKVEELKHPKGRVLVFDIPSRRKGQLIKSTGSYTYPMRAGESLTEMDENTIRSILNEIEPDFSSQIVDGLEFQDLDTSAIKILKKLWAKKSKRKDFVRLKDLTALKNLSLVTDKGLTYASLILLGKKEKIAEFLPDAEIIFEWRQEPTKTSYDFRKTWRGPFLRFFEDIWKELNVRNSRIPFQEGFIQRDIWAFDEKSIREALLNAVAHRDYRIKGKSIFIKASPKEFYIQSPGGFIEGVTLANILEESAWRNRLLAETFEKMGLVERSGQGLNDIYEKSIKDGKGEPDLSKTDDYMVRLRILANVQDKDFILFLEKIANEKQITISLSELIELEHIRTGAENVDLKYKDKFLKSGIIEKAGHGRGTRYILSHNYYAKAGKLGVHTRLIGTSRDSKKQLILDHIKRYRNGCLSDFVDIFPELKIKDIQNLLQELRKNGKIVHKGKRISGYWVLND